MNKASVACAVLAYFLFPLVSAQAQYPEMPGPSEPADTNGYPVETAAVDTPSTESYSGEPGCYFTTPADILDAAYEYAITELGYVDSNSDGTPDYLDPNNYQFGLLDCSTMSAQLNWIFQEMYLNGYLECSQGSGVGVVVGGGHAACYVPGIGIVDPLGQQGEPMHHFPEDRTVFVDDYAPELGESPDPSYDGPFPGDNSYDGSYGVLPVHNEEEVSVDLMPIEDIESTVAEQLPEDYTETMEREREWQEWMASDEGMLAASVDYLTTEVAHLRDALAMCEAQVAAQQGTTDMGSTGVSNFTTNEETSYDHMEQLLQEEQDLYCEIEDLQRQLNECSANLSIDDDYYAPPAPSE